MSHCASQNLSANVFRRGDRFTFRVRVPVCLPLARDRRELVFSLRTDNRRVAMALGAAIRLRITDLWVRLRRMHGTKADLEKIARAWFYRELNEAQRLYMSGDLVRHLHDPRNGEPGMDDLRAFGRHAMGEMAESTIETMRLERQRHDFSRGYEKARQTLERFGITFEEHDQRFTALAKHFMHMESLITETQLRWSLDDLDYVPDFPPLPDGVYPDAPAIQPAASAVPPPSPVEPMSTRAGLTISEAFERYAAERKPKPGTVKGYRGSVQRFVDLIGDLDVAHVSKRHIASFKDALLLYPAVLKAADRGLTSAALIEKYRHVSDVKRLTATTINAKHMRPVRG